VLVKNERVTAWNTRSLARCEGVMRPSPVSVLGRTGTVDLTSLPRRSERRACRRGGGAAATPSGASARFVVLRTISVPQHPHSYLAPLASSGSCPGEPTAPHSGSGKKKGTSRLTQLRAPTTVVHVATPQQGHRSVVRAVAVDERPQMRCSQTVWTMKKSHASLLAVKADKHLPDGTVSPRLRAMS
jgi:hypothetical protein